MWEARVPEGASSAALTAPALGAHPRRHQSGRCTETTKGDVMLFLPYSVLAMYQDTVPGRSASSMTDDVAFVASLLPT